jgi:hypothetical protein
MPEGYTTLVDVRRALRQAQLPGDVQQEKEIAVEAIVSQTEWIEKTYDRHWYAQVGDDILSDATEVTIPQSAKTRDDEHDLPTHGGYVAGSYGTDPDPVTSTTGTVFNATTNRPNPKEEIRLATGDLDDSSVPAYTRIQFERKDVEAVNSLHIVNANGGYDDWVASNDYDGGVGFSSHAGDDFYVRINSGGVSELYIDVHSLDDDLATLSNAVVVDFDYGHVGIPQNVQRAVAFRAGADLAEEAAIRIPQDTTLYDVETKADEMRTQAEEFLEVV